ncbi:hypothetical protein ACIBBG_34235, partial [Micromonospora chersina]|uniref:hypothetical protein n=1 Tax=Micromonospora chersina TaxID=47854 RepID=UPI003787E3AD
ALPTNATDTTSLSTYLYARANPLTYTDPDGRSPLEPGSMNVLPVPGKVTVYIGYMGPDWNHAIGQVTVGEKTTYFEQKFVGRTQDGTPITKIDKLTARQAADFTKEATGHEFTVPNGENAYKAAKALVKNGWRAEYHAECESCLSPIADVLEKGGLGNLPMTTKELANYIIMEGKPVGEYGGEITLRSGFGSVAARTGSSPGVVRATNILGTAVNVLGAVLMLLQRPSLEDWSVRELHEIRKIQMGATHPGDHIICGVGGCGVRLSPDHNSI